MDKLEEVQKNKPHYILLLVGMLLLMVPLVFIIVAPNQFSKAHFFLRIIAALGGGLIGSFIPGMLSCLMLRLEVH